MSHRVVPRRVAAIAAAVTGALAAGGPAASAAPLLSSSATLTASCSAPALTEPFAAFGDTNTYAPLPGESLDSFPATGWTLSGGATVTRTALADGKAGTVLDLPAGAAAVSPPMCVTSGYPSARGQLRSVSGSAGLNLSVTYLTSMQNAAGHLSSPGTAWTLSAPVVLNPSSVPGWQLAQFIISTAGSGEYELSNFYVDPKMRH